MRLRVLGLALGLLAVLVLGVGGFRVLASSPSEQPIAFNHKKHAAFLECTSCHQGATTQASATIPQASFCMTCHQAQVTANPEAEKIKGYFNTGEAIPWVRLFALNKDIVFSHKTHLSAGLECSTCHGDVKNTEFLKAGFGREGQGGKFGRQLMDSCLSCHQERKASTDCLACHK